MNVSICKQRQKLAVDVDAVCRLITATQLPSGEIPWSTGDKTDPWDHVEAAMGLTVGGYLEQARRAFDWLRSMQLADGSWFAAYRKGIPEDRTRETNMSAYIAVGVFHYWLITGDRDFLESMWDTVRRAIDFAVSHQRTNGEICWAISPQGKVDPMALLTGSSSIYMSLKCAMAIADELGMAAIPWTDAYQASRRCHLQSAVPVQHDQIPIFHGLVLPGTVRCRYRRNGRWTHQATVEEICGGRLGGSLRLRPTLGDGRGKFRIGADPGRHGRYGKGAHHLQLAVGARI